MRIAFYVNKSCADVDYSSHDVMSDYCSGDIGTGIIRAYSIIIGDVELDTYRISPDVTLYWAFFTMFAVVILLNVLIAIVTESYLRAFVERSKLFGKVRVPLLARGEFMEKTFELVRPNSRRHRCYRILDLSIILVFEASFIHCLSLMFSKKNDMTVENEEKNQLFSIITGIFFMLVANLAMIVE